jgi:hypothetical protein
LSPAGAITIVHTWPPPAFALKLSSAPLSARNAASSLRELRAVLNARPA